MTDVVIFLDALSPRELEGVLKEWKKGEMDADIPRVTPRVMSSIYTGLNPAENGMMEVSKYGGGDVSRPKKSTFIDQMLREDMSVLSMGMPFCIPFQEKNEDSVVQGTALKGRQQIIPEEASFVDLPAADADMIRSHPDRVYASFRDQTYAYFNMFKENIRRVNPDVAFLGYRNIDSYCHFQHTESRDGKTYRQHLIKDVAHLIERIYKQIDGDVMFFSDHGQTELTDVFRVNRWLKDNGWLDYEVDYDFIDTSEEYQRGENHPANTRVENQFIFDKPGVEIDKEKSKVVCSDPFDSCLTLLVDREDFDEEKFRGELMGTGLYRSVKYKWEIYDEEADFYDRVPDIIPDRKKGVFVSGNLHENLIGMGYYRTGVHDRTACFGATRELNIPDKEKIKPEDMHDIIVDFIGLELTESPLQEEQIKQWTGEEAELVRSNIDEVIGDKQ